MKKQIIKIAYWSLPILLLTIFGGFVEINAQSQSSKLSGEISTTMPGGDTLNLSGAKTVLTSTSQTSTPITVFADESGRFEYREVKPGSYILEVSLDGFVSAKRLVNVGESQTMIENFRLELDGVSASVTVDSETQSINTTDSTVPGTITARNAQNLPLVDENFQDALPLIPGVVRGPDGLMNVKGAQSSQNGTLIGGSNGDDPVTGNSSIGLPLEAVESIQVISNPYSAEFGNFNGGVVQIQTQAGTDKWKMGLSSFMPRLRKRDGGIRGIESATPRIHFGGPLVKGKLFLFQSLEYKFVQTEVENLPDLRSDTKLESFNSFTRVDYNASDNHRISGTVAIFPQKIDFVNLNTFNPQETAANLHQRGWMAAVNDQFVTKAGGILQTTFSVKRTDADVFGNTTSTFTIAPQGNSGGFFNRQERESLRYEAQSIYSLPAISWRGQHLLKFGGGIAYTTFEGRSSNSDIRIINSDGVLNQLQQYSGDGILSRNKTEIGFFVHDKWTIDNLLTLDLGVRFDRDNLGRSVNPAPRLGFSYSPFLDNKTVIRGGVGVFFSKIPINVGVFEQNQNVLIRRFRPDGVTVAGETDYRNVVENSDIKSPYSIGWNVQLDREISNRLMVRVGYEQRETKRDFRINPFLNASGRNGVNELGNGGRSSYREFLIMSRLRLQQDRDLFISYTRSRAAGDLNVFGGFSGNIQNPIIRANQYSRLGFDVPNRFLFWGEFGLPLGISLSPVIDWRTGFPYSVVDQQQNFVGQRNSDRRFDNFFSTDLQIFKDLKIPFRGKEYKLRAGVKLFNLTNHFNPRDIQNNINSEDFGSLSNSVSRKIRFKFEYRF